MLKLYQYHTFSFLLMLMFMLLIFSGCLTPGDIQRAPDTADVPADSTPDFDDHGLFAEPTPKPEKRETRLSFLAAGDNIIHSSIYYDAEQRARGMEGVRYNFWDIYAGPVADMITAADISFINQETPIAGDEFPRNGYPNFNTPREAAYALVEMGFDIVNLANNHMIDVGGETGYRNQLDFWDSKPVLHIGGFRNREDYDTIRIFKRDGISIAFLSYTYGTNGMTLPPGSEMVIPLIDPVEIRRQLILAQGKADLLFVHIHWGHEDWHVPNTQQIELAQLLARYNVDVVIGTHPHVLQPVVWLDRPDGGRTLVAYSIGNFISAQLNGRNMLGALLGFDIVRTVEDTVQIENVKITPIVTHYNRQIRDISLHLFEDYTEELLADHGAHHRRGGGRFTMRQLEDIIRQTISEEFLSEYYRKRLFGE